MKAEIILFIGIALMFGIVGQVILNEVYDLKREVLNFKTERKAMENWVDDSFSSFANGIYLPGCAYVVDVRGRNIEQINRTEYHEACHAFINADMEGHFINKTEYCGGLE